MQLYLDNEHKTLELSSSRLVSEQWK